MENSILRLYFIPYEKSLAILFVQLYRKLYISIHFEIMIKKNKNEIKRRNYVILNIFRDSFFFFYIYINKVS